MKDISLKELLEAGCHFGHKASRWNPQSKQYIYTEQGNIHIIDLAKTKQQLELAAAKLQEIAQKEDILLLVGTKRQAAKVVEETAKNAGLPYLTSRWIGGFITNWEQVKRSIDRMNDLAKQEKEGAWEPLPKHERVKLKAQLERMQRVYGGVADLTELPRAIYIVDVRLEKTATREAVQAGVLSIGISDTNADPRVVDIAIPSNDDAVSSIQLITNYLVDAYLEGRKSAAEIKKKAKIKAEKEEQKAEKKKIEAERKSADKAKKKAKKEK